MDTIDWVRGKRFIGIGCYNQREEGRFYWGAILQNYLNSQTKQRGRGYE